MPAKRPAKFSLKSGICSLNRDTNIMMITVIYNKDFQTVVEGGSLA